MATDGKYTRKDIYDALTEMEARVMSRFDRIEERWDSKFSSILKEKNTAHEYFHAKINSIENYLYKAIGFISALTFLFTVVYPILRDLMRK